MKNKIKKTIFKLKKKFGLLSADEMVAHLREIGIKIGKGTKIFDDDVFIDEQRPWMIEIGEYCKITKGVIILQHDYSRSVLRRVYGNVIGESEKTVIGNNVFIGMNTIILMGVHVGDNVIIGAGSVVSRDIPSNVVVAGNPARVIKSIDDHYSERKEKYIFEAFETFNLFVERYHREPSIVEMGSFWPLYLKKEMEELQKNNILTKLSGDNEDEIIECWLNDDETPLFTSYEKFKIAAKEFTKMMLDEKNV